MSRIFSSLACIILAASLFGCKAKFVADDAHPFVRAYTSGVISIMSPVRVVLTDDAMKTPLLFGQLALEKFVKIAIDNKNGEILYTCQDSNLK